MDNKENINIAMKAEDNKEDVKIDMKAEDNIDIKAEDNMEDVKIDIKAEDNMELNKTTKLSIKNIILTILLCICVVAASFGIAKYCDEMTRVPSKKMQLEFIPTVVNIELDGGHINNRLENVAVNLRTTVANYYNLVNSDEIISDYEFFDDSLYVNKYDKNGNGLATIYSSNNLLDIEVFNKEEESQVIEKYNSDPIIKEDTFVNEVPDDTETKDGGEPKIKYKLSITNHNELHGLYKEGYLIELHQYASDIENLSEEELGNTEFTHSTQTVFDNIKYCKTKKIVHDKYLNIKGIGLININDIEEINNTSALAYNSSYDMVRIVNSEIGNTVLFITGMYNQNLGNTFENMTRYKDYNNVYIDNDFEDHSKFGYGGFSVQTEYGMYYFKVSEDIEDPHEFMDRLLDMMQIKPDDKEINILISPFEASINN